MNGTPYSEILNDYGLDTYDTKGLICTMKERCREIDGCGCYHPERRRNRLPEKILKVLPANDPVHWRD